jgi:hypothetical protein
LVFTLGVVAACSGSQAETIYDGGGGGDSGIIVTNHSSVHVGAPDTGGFIDTGITFIDTGSSATSSAGFGDTGAPNVPDGSIVPPTGDGGGGGGVCPSSCTADSECQMGCPASPGAINCCDTVTSACFTSAASECPDMIDSGGGGTGGDGGGGY